MHWNSGDTPESLAASLADAVAGQLRTALRARGKATLALSGGSTPKLFMEHLAEHKLDWANVTVTLVDERWVPPDDPRSNAGLLRKHLLRSAASAARFVPLYVKAPTPEAGMPRVVSEIAKLELPLDVVVLGMGAHGHTASFFPRGDHLEQALDPGGSARILPMRAPAAGEPRITLTLPVLVGARALYLLITGDAKRRVLIEAVNGADYPMRAVLDAAPGLQAYWCP